MKVIKEQDRNRMMKLKDVKVSTVFLSDDHYWFKGNSRIHGTDQILADMETGNCYGIDHIPEDKMVLSLDTELVIKENQG
jgi:hypothetical protein